jgi:hypothetical protein
VAKQKRKRMATPDNTKKTKSKHVGKSCTYADQTYSDGAVLCQSGTEYVCKDGGWESLGTSCRGTPVEDIGISEGIHEYPGGIHPARETRAEYDVGPFKFKVRFNGQAVDVEVFLGGVKIGSGKLSLANSQLKCSGNIGAVKGDVTIRADFRRKEAVAVGTYCHRKLGLHPKWVCHKFNTKIYSW